MTTVMPKTSCSWISGIITFLKMPHPEGFSPTTKVRSHKQPSLLIKGREDNETWQRQTQRVQSRSQTFPGMFDDSSDGLMNKVLYDKHKDLSLNPRKTTYTGTFFRNLSKQWEERDRRGHSPASFTCSSMRSRPMRDPVSRTKKMMTVPEE